MVANAEQLGGLDHGATCALALRPQIIPLPLYHIYALTAALARVHQDRRGSCVLITDPRDMPAFHQGAWRKNKQRPRSSASTRCTMRYSTRRAFLRGCHARCELAAAGGHGSAKGRRRIVGSAADRCAAGRRLRLVRDLTGRHLPIPSRSKSGRGFIGVPIPSDRGCDRPTS